MKVRRATWIYGLVLGLAAILATQLLPLLSNSAIAADDGMKWQFNEANDPDNKGRMTARLIYGVPETDAVQVSGVCEARSGSGPASVEASCLAPTSALSRTARRSMSISPGTASTAR